MLSGPSCQFLFNASKQQAKGGFEKEERAKRERDSVIKLQFSVKVEIKKGNFGEQKNRY